MFDIKVRHETNSLYGLLKGMQRSSLLDLRSPWPLRELIAKRPRGHGQATARSRLNLRTL